MEGAPVVVNVEDHDIMDLPPGFRFHPTDEEIITHYLTEKVMDNNFNPKAIGEVDLNKCEPWDLPKRAKMGEKEWYFFFQRDRKYPTGTRTNRATESGYWKATGKDKEIYKGKTKTLIGMKKTLVFYRGRAPKGEKTNWVMHEFRLEGKFSYFNFSKAPKDEWVVSRIFHKNTATKRSSFTDVTRMNSFVDDFFDNNNSLPPLTDSPNLYNNIYAETNFKGRSSDGNSLSHFSTSMNNNHQLLQMQQDHKNFTFPHNNYTYQASASNQTPNSIFYPQIPLPNNNYHKEIIDSILIGQCKVEQFSTNQSTVSISRETGLSTDLTAEISSVVSKQDMGASIRSSEDLEGPFLDFDSIWNY